MDRNGELCGPSPSCGMMVRNFAFFGPIEAMRWWIGFVNLGFGRLSRPNPVAARCKAWVSGRSLAGIAGSSPAGGKGVCLL